METGLRLITPSKGSIYTVGGAAKKLVKYFKRKGSRFGKQSGQLKTNEDLIIVGNLWLSVSLVSLSSQGKVRVTSAINAHGLPVEKETDKFLMCLD